MNIAPTISVILPVYNGGVPFEKVLQGLAKCDPQPLEIIVVDDSSSDHSVYVAAQYGTQVLTTGGRLGPARARNLGAEAARGEVLFFVDADVVVHTDAVGIVAHLFDSRPDVAACFGSYDESPSDPGLVSQWKNLAHHYVHQQAIGTYASTFWAGCGAVRREVFLALGGFSSRYARPAIEDIELGYRLNRRGHKIVLQKNLLGSHLKRWTLTNLVKTDIVDRAVPWTELMLEQGVLSNDLNLEPRSRLSVAVLGAGLLLAFLASLTALRAQTGYATILVIAALACFVALLALNLNWYRFFASRKGPAFLLVAIGLHWLYYGYSALGFVIGWTHFRWLQTCHARRPISVELPALDSKRVNNSHYEL